MKGFNLLKNNDAYYERELKKLLSVTPKQYADYYQASINNYYLMIESALPIEIARQFKETAIKRAIAALKIKRGYMLPVGADTETCYREQDVWTFAIFIASLCHDFTLIIKMTCEELGARLLFAEKNINLLCIKFILPSHCWIWLSNHPTLFELWKDCLSFNKINQNTIRTIINYADEKLLACTPKFEKHSEEENYKTSISLAELVINYLQVALKENRISVNKSDSFCYQVNKGFFLKLPNFFDWLKQYPEFVNLELRQLTELDVFFMKSDNNDYIHLYYEGEWEVRKEYKGLLLPITSFSEGLFVSNNNYVLKPVPKL